MTALPLEKIPVLVVAVMIVSAGLAAFLHAALYKGQKPGLVSFGLSALGVAWTVSTPLWEFLPCPLSPGVTTRLGAALDFLLPATCGLFLIRFLAAPLDRRRRILFGGAGALGLLAFARPGLSAFDALAPLVTALLLADFFRALLQREGRSRRHMAVLFVAVTLLVLGALLDLASRREVLVTSALPVPALGPAFLVFLVLALFAMAHEDRRLIARATTDPLTTLPNRAAFLDRARTELQRADRLDRSLAVVMIDIDHFKGFNDRFGHATGDRVLYAVAQAIAQTIRGIDVAGRWGGEEFAVLLVEADEASAPPAVERIREAVAALAPPRVPGPLTISAGIAVHRGRFERSTIERLLRRADTALYQAKRSGRNRVSSERPAAQPGKPSELLYR